MIYFLIVVTVGGSSSITGPFLASLLLGIGDVAGKYYVPKLGAVRDLHHHDRDPDLASERPVRPRRAREPA
jgi:ABC-type branched-subunit amino acid transport system permease subunit